MFRFWIPALVVAALAGCQKGPTTLLIEIAIEQGDTPPPSLLVSLYDRFGAIAPRDERIKNPPPGKLVITGLPDEAQTIRVAMRGGTARARFGALSIDAKPREQKRGTVTLLAAMTDTDGDFVPDVIDNCPTVPNPDQNEAGEGAGNACRELPMDDLTTTVVDNLSTVIEEDLLPDPNADMTPPPPDLTPPPDLIGADLTALPDLKPPADLKPPVDMAIVPDMKPANPTLCPGRVFSGAKVSSRGHSRPAEHVVQTNATVTVSTTRAYRGTRSMKVTNNAPGATLGRIESDNILSPSTTTVYVRAFIYREPGGPAYSAYFEALPAAGGTGYQAATSLLTGALRTYAPNTDVVASTNQFGYGRWDCVEWQLSYGATGFQQLWINDSAAIDMTPLNMPEVDQFFFGWGSMWEDKAGVVYFDEVVIDDARIGCSK